MGTVFVLNFSASSALKDFCSSSKECPPPTVGPWNFSKRKILYHVLHMYMCISIYIYIYVYRYIYARDVHYE